MRLTWKDALNMETLAQEMIAEYYGKPVNPSFVAIEIAALVLGHAGGKMDDAHERLYASLVAAGEIRELHAPSAR
jgi:hypothetical protein